MPGSDSVGADATWRGLPPPPPGGRAAEWQAWVAANDVEHPWSMPMSIAGQHGAPQPPRAAPWATTVGAWITGQAGGAPTRDADRQQDGAFLNGLAGWMCEAADRVASARAELAAADDWEVEPGADVAVAEVHAQIRSARRAYLTEPALHVPAPWSSRGPDRRLPGGPLRTVPHLSVAAAGAVRAAAASMPARVAVSVAGRAWCRNGPVAPIEVLIRPGPRERAVRAPECSLHAARCPHVVGALVALEWALTQPDPDPELVAACRDAARPEWAVVLDERAAASAVAAQQEVAWRVATAGYDATIEARLPAPAGKGARYLKVSPQALADVVLADDDALVYALVRAAAQSASELKSDLTLAALRVLAQRATVVDALGAPAKVRFVPLQWRLVPVRDGWVRVAVAVGLTPIDSEVAAAALAQGRRFIADTEGDQVCVGVVTEAIAARARAMRPCTAMFPADQAHRVAAWLRTTGAPVALPDPLRGERLVADDAVVVLLSGRDDGVAVAFEVWPFGPDARVAIAPPGEGEAEHDTEVEGLGAFWLRRDLDGERAHARSVADALGLRGAGWEWTIFGEDAVELLERLQDPPPRVRVRWRDTTTPKRVTRAQVDDLRVFVSQRRDWFALAPKLVVEGREVDVAKAIEAIRAGKGYLNVDGGMVVRLTDALRARLQRIAEAAHAHKGVLAVQGLHAALIGDDVDRSAAPVAWKRAVDATRAEPPPVPAGFTSTLRGYQVDGVRWMLALSTWAPGAVLADDMGLGKTLQALAVLVARAPAGAALVVAPLSVLQAWQREAALRASGLRVIALASASDADVAAAGVGDVVLASWDRMTRRQDAVGARDWATLVCDEAQAIKNASTRRAQAVFRLAASFRIALTGTPVENRTGELWSVMRAAVPGLFGSWEEFRDRFAGPIDRDGAPDARAALARMVRPFLLRRIKRDVAPELPARTEVDLDVVLSPDERALYEAHRRIALAQIDEAGGRPPDQQRFVVLAALTRLRQLACHPRLVDEASDVRSTKLALLVEKIQQVAGEGHRALVFSQFVRHLTLVRDALGIVGVPCRWLDGSMSEKARRVEIDAFQDGSDPVFLLSLKAAGTGLTLTAATYVFHLDPWWNPAVEDQATDRAHRIGQHRPVTVYRLVARDTVEDQILQLHAEKRRLVADLLDGTGKAAGLSTRELIDLLREAATVEVGEPD